MARSSVIAIDIDDVLSASAEGFAVYSNKRWGHTLTTDDYQEEWAKVWGIPLSETLTRAAEFHGSGVVGDYRHFEDALPVLKKLTKNYNLILVTSRRKVLQAETSSWLERYFKGIFKDVHYVGMWDQQRHLVDDVQTSIRATKTQICKEIGASYLIDDQLKHCLDAANAGMTALLFGNYRWNRRDVLPARVIRAGNWQAVEEYFDGQS